MSAEADQLARAVVDFTGTSTVLTRVAVAEQAGRNPALNVFGAVAERLEHVHHQPARARTVQRPVDPDPRPGVGLDRQQSRCDRARFQCVGQWITGGWLGVQLEVGGVRNTDEAGPPAQQRSPDPTIPGRAAHHDEEHPGQEGGELRWKRAEQVGLPDPPGDGRDAGTALDRELSVVEDLALVHGSTVAAQPLPIAYWWKGIVLEVAPLHT